MTPESTETEQSSLGDLLRQTRLKQGVELKNISTETKITVKCLEAIEAGDYESMPAEVFTRGFYTLYAKALNLNPEEILDIYSEEKAQLTPESKRPSLPPNKLAKQFGNMAERPTAMPVSFTGLIILFLLLTGAFLSWYFSWNPATFLSEKLRSLQNNPESVEQIVKVKDKPESNTPYIEETQVKATVNTTEKIALPELAAQKYILNATFIENTEVTLTIDDGPKQHFSYSKGETAHWKAGEKMAITLPAKGGVRLTLNEIPIEFPDSQGKYVTILIPEYLLGQ